MRPGCGGPIHPLAVGDPTKVCKLGTHRCCAPEETIARLRPLFGEAGISRVANVTHLDWIGIPVVMVVRPNSRMADVCQGKGLTLTLAKASGLMEAVEAWHAEHIDAPLRLASHGALRQAAVDVERLENLVLAPFHSNLDVLWIEGFDLLSQRPAWVPLELVSCDFRATARPQARCFASSTNGLAGGNHFLEAVSSAICEVVERDSTALFYAADQQLQHSRRIALDSVEEESCARLLSLYRAAGVAVALWDTTTDIGIPAFLCRIHQQRPGPLLPSVAEGMGCHPTRAVALLRALTEAAQSRLTEIAGVREDRSREVYEAQSLSRARSSLDAWEAADAGRALAATADYDFDSFAAEVRWECEQLRGAGVDQLLVVDLTRPEWQVPVVRVVIPGLEGMTFEQGDVKPGERALNLRRHVP